MIGYGNFGQPYGGVKYCSFLDRRMKIESADGDRFHE